MSKTRVFVSFDFDNDFKLKQFIIGQSRHSDSPFEVIDMSLKEAAPEKEWEEKARAAISRAQVFMVMLGRETSKAPGVLKEVLMATELNKPMFQIVGYSDGTTEWAVPGAGKAYRWNWENLKKLLDPAKYE